MHVHTHMDFDIIKFVSTYIYVYVHVCGFRYYQICFYIYMHMYMNVDFDNIILVSTDIFVIHIYLKERNLIISKSTYVTFFFSSIILFMAKVTLVFEEYILKEYNVLETICE
jgi:hypothetical protein